jgi:hypothetical protein
LNFLVVHFPLAKGRIIDNFTEIVSFIVSGIDNGHIESIGVLLNQIVQRSEVKA